VSGNKHAIVSLTVVKLLPTGIGLLQANHLFAALCAFIKLEWLWKTTKLNHFALKSKFYVAALHSAYAILRRFQPIQFAA
jgi:hypothetical protein